jgi:hypothetical protein
MAKSMTQKLFGAGEMDILLFLHTEQAPSSAEWNETMTFLTGHARNNDLRRFRVLVLTDGGGPDLTMRGQLQEFFKTTRQSPRIAVVTTSVLSRGIVAAVSWFNPNVKAFPPSQFASALAHLEVASSSTPRLLREFAELQRELAPVACLKLVNGLSTRASV